MFAPVYLDHNATTPLAPSVLDAMLPFMGARTGNASSRHEYGREARRAIDEARQRVAHAVGAHPTEVVFTSGGSEANNLFIKGAATARRVFSRDSGRFPCIAISAIEHPCVREPAMQLAKAGGRVREVGVDAMCRITSADLRAALEPIEGDAPAHRPAVVSLMLANNETGVIQDIAELAPLVAASGAWLHSDAVQAFGKLPINFRVLNAAGLNALTLSSHKIGGPQGAGALILDKRVELVPQIAGGGQERGLRSGTENVAAIVGFGLAAELAQSTLEARAKAQRALRAQLESTLHKQGATVFASAAERLPNTTFFAFDHVDGETLVGRLDRAGFAVASGAACSSSQPEASRVLLAMGITPALAKGAVRVSVGHGNTTHQIDHFVTALAATLDELRGLRAVCV
jgi:cysteine desulfurase